MINKVFQKKGFFTAMIDYYNKMLQDINCFEVGLDEWDNFRHSILPSCVTLIVLQPPINILITINY